VFPHISEHPPVSSKRASRDGTLNIAAQ